MPNVGPPKNVMDPSEVFNRQKILDNVRGARNSGRTPMPGGVVVAPQAESPNEFRSRTLAENGVGGLVDRVT